MKVSMSPCLLRKDLEKYQSISARTQPMHNEGRRDDASWVSLVVDNQ